jgi:hypothetical protein
MDEKTSKKLMRELRQIRNVLIALAMKSGVKSEELGAVTGMGASNVRGLFVNSGGRSKKKQVDEDSE